MGRFAGGDEFDAARRRLLRAGLAAGSSVLVWPRAWAEVDRTLKLLRAPKVALVIGNGKYLRAPVLRNAASDAEALAAQLRNFGYDAMVRVDADRAGMEAAIGAYADAIAKRGSIGFFYYAGHAVQLAWHNYLVPVDAAVASADDIQRGCVDASGLMAGLRKAANPLNVIVLDACRDNPFGDDVRLTGRGLSQMDTPSNTLLAYATAPGSAASDGDGTHGLYTESLLREMQVPEARLEDVFKRARLAVRKRSGGAQIPWESTSFEDDFYFIPPAELTRQSEAEREKEFKEQLAAWQQIQNSREPEVFYQYLQAYPNGLISERAQFRLDQLEVLRIEPQAGPDGVKPLTSGKRRYNLGNEFVYDRVDRYSGNSTRFTQRVNFADDVRVEMNGGSFVTDQMGAVLVDRFGVKSPGSIIAPADIAVGKHWRTVFTNTRRNGATTTNFWEFRVVALEDMTVPAGTFRAFRVEGKGEARGTLDLTFMAQTRWIDPATMIYIRLDRLFRSARGSITEYSSDQLVSVKRATR